MEHHIQAHFSWIAVLLMAAVLAATIIFGSRISAKLDRLEEGLVHNGKGLDRIAEQLLRNGEGLARIGEGLARIEGRADTTPAPPSPRR